MRRSFVLLLAMGVCLSLQAQTFSEWFFQKKTQIKYLKNQILALAAYDELLEKGYDIALDGTDAISTVKEQDFDLHSGYFSSLKTVNPAVRGSPEVKGTMRLAAMIVEVAGQVKTGVVADAAAGIEADCEEDVAFLQMLVMDGELEMSDADRMKAIAILYARMKRRCVAVMTLRNQMTLLQSNF